MANRQRWPGLHLVDRHAAEWIASPLSTGLADGAFDQAAIGGSESFPLGRRMGSISGNAPLSKRERRKSLSDQ
jgi:hypothetical protein